MEHAEARELLEIAAVEPGGFARLVAGDTPEAAALAGHLAGCETCAAEMERLRRSASVIRDAVRLLPPPDLRDRTLAYVAAVGRPRGAQADAWQGAAAGADSPPQGVASLNDAPRGRVAGSSLRPALWVASLAAAIIIAVAGTAFFVGQSRDGQIAAQAEEIDHLLDIAAGTIKVDSRADARHVALASTTGGAAGTLVFSPSTTDVVVVATGLTPPAAGLEYRCWVETGGTRQKIGRMFLWKGLAYWVGSADSIGALGPGSTFGISAAPASGDSIGGEPVLVGHS